MNERIEKLARQADATVLGTMTGKKQYTLNAIVNWLNNILENFKND